MSVKQNLKIAYVLHRFPVLSETFVIDEISAIKKSGIDISIFSFEKSVDKAMHEEAESLMKDVSYALNPKNSIKIFVQVLMPNLFFFLASPLKYSYYFFEYFFKIGKKEFLQMLYLGHLIRKKSVQHLHAHFAGLGATAAMLISRFLNITFSFTVHAHDIFAEDDFLEEKLKEAKFIIAISDYNRNYLLRRFADIPDEKIKVIHCGVDAEKFKPVDSQGGEVMKVLSGGRLIEKKGFCYLLKACKLLIDRSVKFRCEIFGDGPLKENLANEARELGLEKAVHFTGAVTREESVRLLAESDIFVLPSIIADDGDRDGIPVVLMEAMACRKPVVSTDVSGIPELIDSGENGLLVHQKDCVALAEVIARLAEDKELRSRIGLKAREKILEEFNIHNTASTLHLLFKGVLCNLCGAAAASIIFSQYVNRIKYDHVRCKECGLIYADPMPRMTNAQMNELSIQLWHRNFISRPDGFDWPHFKKAEESNRLKVEALEKYKKGQRLLEVGCGNGFFLAAAKKKGWDIFGVDICKDLCDYVKKHLKLNIYAGTLEDAGFEDSYFDAVYLDNTLEHMTDPASFLKEVYRVLKNGGVVFISVPNSKAVINELRRRLYYLGIKRAWKGYLDIPMHLYSYSPATLKMMLGKTGFKILRLFTVGPGCKVYYPDFSKFSLKKVIKRGISCGAVILGRGILLNVYAVKDNYG